MINPEHKDALPKEAQNQPMPQSKAEAEAAYAKGVAALDAEDYTTALKMLMPLAKLGHASAQNDLGFMYINGHGVHQNYAEAVKWFRKAATQGDADAQGKLDTIEAASTDKFDAMAESALTFNQFGPQVRPWIRFWARIVDLGLFGLLFAFLANVLPLLAEIYLFYGGESIIAQNFVLLFLYVFVEPALLSSWGTTPGKALLNVRLRNNDGNKLTYGEAFARSIGVWLYGFCMGIPLLNLFTLLFASHTLRKNGVTSWDREGDFKVQHKPVGFVRPTAAIAIVLFLHLGIPVIAMHLQTEAQRQEAQKRQREGAELRQRETTKKARRESGLMRQAHAAFAEGVAAYAAGNYTQAAEWYRKAADQGHAMAQGNLGDMYALGEGVQQDDRQAAKWYRKAAHQGDAAAQLLMGRMHGLGKGVPQDYVLAVKWFRKAAGQGDANAQYVLGGLYMNGINVPQDYVQATEWFRKAVRQGHADAQTSLNALCRKGYRSAC